MILSGTIGPRLHFLKGDYMKKSCAFLFGIFFTSSLASNIFAAQFAIDSDKGKIYPVVGTSSASVIDLIDGGTGAALVDPDADRIFFWDDSLGATTFLTVGSGLDITGTTLTATGGSQVFQTTSNVANLVTSTDDMTVGNSTDYGKLGVVGDTDEIQLNVRCNATQTAHCINGEASDGTDFFYSGPAGTTVSSTGTEALTLGAGGQATYVVTGDVSGTDTTLTLGSATAGFSGTVTSNSVLLDTISASNTLTNKRITKRAVSTTQSATPTINTDVTDVSHITGLAQAITSMTTNLSGTPVQGDTLRIDITDDGSARAITWGTSFEASGNVALPTTTVLGVRLDIAFVWNTVTSKWRVVGVA